MKRALAALGLLLAASQAQALGLGEARVISGLNAPLVAEIAVVDATPAELAALRAEIPGRDVFTRYGIDRPGFLDTASVTLRRTGEGAPALVVRTEQPVADPFVTLLVAANWGRGRVLREFNLVVDRPSETAEALTPIEVQSPTVGSERSGTVERAPEAPGSAGQVAPPPSSREDAPRGGGRMADAVTVRRGDTLYEISQRLARGSGASASEIMVGLYRANPEAFGATMNDLRSGAVLRVPDLAELAALPPAAVSAEVGRAVSAWRNRSGDPTRAADPAGRLRLVAPSEVAVGSGDKAAASASTEAAAAAADPAAKPAAPQASARPDETPEQRLARIEQSLLEKERLLEVTSAQLAELQAKVSAAPPAPEAGLTGTLRALFGKAWWLWALLLLATLALLGVLMAARRRAAAAEAELHAWASAPRREPEPSAVASTVSSVESAADDDIEGDPPIVEEAGSKLDLARAFIEMGDTAAARAELEAVLQTGNEAQREEARRLLDSLS